VPAPARKVKCCGQSQGKYREDRQRTEKCSCAPVISDQGASFRDDLVLPIPMPAAGCTPRYSSRCPEASSEEPLRGVPTKIAKTADTARSSPRFTSGCSICHEDVNVCAAATDSRNYAAGVSPVSRRTATTNALVVSYPTRRATALPDSPATGAGSAACSRSGVRQRLKGMPVSFVEVLRRSTPMGEHIRSESRKVARPGSRANTSGLDPVCRTGWLC